MIRFLEVALFLAPLALFVAWRVLLPDRELTPRTIAALAAVLVVMFALLYWFRMEDAAPAGTTYVPQALQDGRIVPPRAVP